MNYAQIFHNQGTRCIALRQAKQEMPQSKTTTEKRIPEGVWGRPESPQKSAGQNHNGKENCVPEGGWIKIRRSLRAESPKKLQDKTTTEKKNACPKGFGGERKAPKKPQGKPTTEKWIPEGAWIKIRRSLRAESPQKSHRAKPLHQKASIMKNAADWDEATAF